MKKIFNNTTIKKIASIGLGLAIVLVFALATSSGFAQDFGGPDAPDFGGPDFQTVDQGGDPSLLRKSGGSMNAFQLVPKFQESAFMQTLGMVPNPNLLIAVGRVVFRVSGTSLFDTVMVNSDAYFDSLFVGFTTNENLNPANADLNVNGRMRIASLADPLAPPLVPACVNDFGKIERCPLTSSGSLTMLAQCGPSGGTTVSSEPTLDVLCQVGSPGPVTFAADTYSWTCTEAFSVENCSANYLSPTAPAVNGQCASFTGSYEDQPSPQEACSAGNFNNIEPNSDTEFLWECEGLNGGQTVACDAAIAPEPVSPQCAEFPGIHESQPADETNGCDSGEFADLDNSDTEFLWECQGINGGDSVNCSAAMEIECLAPTLTSLVCPNEVNFTLNGATNVIATSIYSSTNGTAWSGGNTGSEVSPRNIDLIDGNYYRMQSICSGSVFSPDSNVLKYSASTCDDPFIPNDPGPASCHPLIYPEVTGLFSVIAENYCSGRPTQTECMYSNSYWWNQSVDGQGLYGNPVLSTPLTGGYETFAAHSYGQVGVNSGIMAADSGLNLDLTGQTLPSNIDVDLNPCTVSSNFQCQRILGPVCIWRS